jgi:hypothetical protein
MGSGYVKDIRVEINFDEQDIVVTLRPLQRGDLFRLQAALPRDPNKPDVVLINAQALEAFEMYADLLSNKYVKDSNVIDSEGQPVPVAEWAVSAYHLPLLTRLMAKHMEKATPSNPSLSAAVPDGSSS